MIAALDVQYGAALAAAACVTFERWSDATPASEHSELIASPASYVSGEFWRRELPCLQAVLARLAAPPAIVVIDGYVWLDVDRPGLGARLFDALGGAVAVVGVAKTAFRGSAHARGVLRGQSRRPLYVTARGLPDREAAEAVHSMHGDHRIPSLLQRVDQLCRAALRAGSGGA